MLLGICQLRPQVEDFLVKLGDFRLLLRATVALIDAHLIATDFTHHVLTIAADLRDYCRLLQGLILARDLFEVVSVLAEVPDGFAVIFMQNFDFLVIQRESVTHDGEAGRDLVDRVHKTVKG